jgi:thiol-disulfide isomerase/thioredoxin
MVFEKWITNKPQTDGKFIMLEFWRTTSERCRENTPLLNAFQKKYADNLVVISVTGESEAIQASYDGPKKEYYQVVDQAQGTLATTKLEGGCGTGEYEPQSDSQAVDTDRNQGITEAAYGVFAWPHIVLIEPQYGVVVWEGYPIQDGYELTEEKLEMLFSVHKKMLSEKKKTTYKSIPTQFIAATASPSATSGTNAHNWGIWRVDPGPRGVSLDNCEILHTENKAPANWEFDEKDWWLEEHGLIMEAPEFPLPAGKYVVTGDREVTTILTVSEPDSEGNQNWQLADNAILEDVTHIPCRSSRYTPDNDFKSGVPTLIGDPLFPLAPGEKMPEVQGCKKQDYAVLFVIGIVE